jgi:amino acid transporter
MVAGWDHLLPAWFTRLHPKYRTPVNSIVVLGAVTLATCIATLIGVRDLEAFTTLQIWGFTFYGLAYLALFAIPLLARKESQLRAGSWTKIAAVFGLALTAMFVALAIVPVVNVANRGVYAAKTIAVLMGANTFALLLYRK